MPRDVSWIKNNAKCVNVCRQTLSDGKKVKFHDICQHEACCTQNCSIPNYALMSKAKVHSNCDFSIFLVMKSKQKIQNGEILENVAAIAILVNIKQ